MNSSNDEVFDPGLALQGNPAFAAYVAAHPDADPDKVMQMFMIDHPEVLEEVLLPLLKRRDRLRPFAPDQQ